MLEKGAENAASFYAKLIPISASRIAAQSLAPSPTIATSKCWSMALSSLTTRAFCSGRARAKIEVL
jgi:hypothetical protein